MSKCKRCDREIRFVKIHTGTGWAAWDVEADCWHNLICGSKPGRKKKISEVEQIRAMASSFEARNSEDAFTKE